MVWKFVESAVRRAIRPYYYLGPRRGLTQLRNGLRIFVDPADQDLTPTIVSRGWWEPQVTHAILKRLQPGDCAVDAGANCGYFTLLMAKAVGPRGHIFAFEANRRMASLVQESVRLNGFEKRVTVIPHPIADAVKQLQFVEYAEHGAAGHIFQGNGHNVERDVVLRDTVTLDGTIPAGKSLRMLRMDVEGAESLIIAGGRAVIDRSPNLCIVTEWSQGMASQHAATESSLEFLKAQGFRPYTIESRNQEAPTTFEKMASADISNFVLTR
jgi:FkbM family methyltransferase